MKYLAMAFLFWGWALVFVLVLVLTGCGEAQTWAADQASLADAIAQAAKEAGR